MVSEMSSTTQRGAAAAAVEVRRTRAMPRREVRSSILCAALQPCVSRECRACWTAATTHACNALVAMLRTRWSQVAPLRAADVRCKQNSESNASGLQDTSKQAAPIHHSQDESSNVLPSRADKPGASALPRAQDWCEAAPARSACRPSQRWNPSAKRSADIRSDGILERLALFQAGTAAADR